MTKLVFKVPKVNVDTIYEIIKTLNSRGFIINPKAIGFKAKYTRSIVVDLQEGIYTPFGLAVFDDPSKFYFIEVED